MEVIEPFIKSNSTNDIEIARESKLGQFMVNNKIKYISGPCYNGGYITVVNGMHILVGVPDTRSVLQYIMCSVCGCYDGEHLSNVNPKNKRCICKCDDQPAPISFISEFIDINRYITNVSLIKLMLWCAAISGTKESFVIPGCVLISNK